MIIVGSGQVAHLLADKIENHPEYGLRVAGFVDRDDRAVVSGNGKSALLGTTEDLPRLVREYGVHRVAIAFSTDSHDQTLGVIRSMQDTRRSDRHRSANVRGARNQRAAPHDRGDAAGRSSAPAPVRLVAVPQAVVRSRRGCDRDGAPVAGVRRRRGDDQARLQRAGVLPPGPDGSRGPDVPRLQVPDDGRGRGEHEARRRAPEHAQRWRCSDVQGAGRSASDAARPRPAAVADRRAAAAPERLGRDDVASSGRGRSSSTRISTSRAGRDDGWISSLESRVSGRCSERATSRSRR